MTRRWLLWPPSVPRAGGDRRRRARCRARATRCRGWRSRCRRRGPAIHPPRTRRATAGPPPVWTTAGPAHGQDAGRRRPGPSASGRPEPGSWVALGFSVETSESMNSNAEHAPGPLGGAHPHPVGPHHDARRRRGCGAAAWSGPSRPSPVAVDDEPAVHLGPVGRDPAAVEADLGGQVGGGVEARRERRRRPAAGSVVGLADLLRVGAVDLEQLGQGAAGPRRRRR